MQVTWRGIARVALVAAEAAAHFERRGAGEDAMEWMLRASPLFDGLPALEACVELDACTRGLLLHMLDLEPAEDMAAPEHVASERSAAVADRSENGGPRLYSCMVAHDGDDGRSWTFDAIVATGPMAARRVLSARHGTRLSREATIVEGFDRKDPYVAALVAPRLADAIELAAADPRGSAATGLEVSVVQRIAA